LKKLSTLHVEGFVGQDERDVNKINPETSCSPVLSSLINTNLERIKKFSHVRRIVRTLWRANDELIGPATDQENAGLEDPVAGIRRKLDCRIAVDDGPASAHECRIDALDEVIAICFQFSLAVEVEAWIVIHPSD